MTLNGPLTTNDFFFIYPRIHFLSCECRHLAIIVPRKREKESKYDMKIPQSHTADQPTAA